MSLNVVYRPDHKQVSITEGFWKKQLDKIHNITIWDVLNKFENDHKEGIMKNYEWVAEGRSGKHIGPPWYDGLICEVIRGISDFIAVSYDEALDKKIEYYTEKITRAQEMDPGGYINTYTTLMCPDKRWGENGGSLIWQHDTYNIGCLIEAGIHYYKAVGKVGLLKCSIKAADCMCKVMGPEPKKNIVPAHSLAEEALVKLYQLLKSDSQLKERLEIEEGLEVNPDKYLNLVRFWMDHRGVHHNRVSFPHYMGEYAQDHCKIEEQSEAVGHAVRAALLYTGLVSLGIETQEEKYLNAAKRIWDNVEKSKLHISGGIGAVHNEERFGYQYDLPNNAYLETCAGVALAFWAGEMYRAFGASRYMDVFECALYNNILPGLSVDGVHYFYENPLISDGVIERWDWHGCPCCPPMFLKLMGSLQDYIFAADQEKVIINLHIGSKVNMLVQGSEVVIEQKECGIPFKGENSIIIHTKERKTFTLAIRKPAWVNELKATIGGETFAQCNEKGYVEITRGWKDGDQVSISMDLEAVKVEAHPFVSVDIGKVALQRGPLLYCLEEIDNPGGTDIMLGHHELRVERQEMFEEQIVCIKGNSLDGTEFTAIPYYLWNNRGKGTMRVWVNQKKKGVVEDSEWETTGGFAAHIAGNHVVTDLSDWQGKLYRRYCDKE